jgi:hypothetical protein
MINKETFKNPPIFVDFLQFYKKFYKSYSNLPKIFRVTMGKDVLVEVSSCMKYVCEINFQKNISYKENKSIDIIHKLRATIELLKSYILFAMETKIISNGFFIELFACLEKISKQAAAWEKWIKRS